jgi:hypothetical protein
MKKIDLQAARDNEIFCKRKTQSPLEGHTEHDGVLREEIIEDA